MRVSVITVCKNSESTIEKAAKSVISQTYENREYIIIDGGSTDRTVDIIRKHEDKVDVLLSEPDSGIYNAMNKGIARSSGDVLFFLNSDDYFHDDQVLSDIIDEFRKDSEVKVVYGNAVMFGGGSEKLVRHDNVTKEYFYKNTICHQAVFARKEVYEIVGNFSEKYKIHADTDWLMRAYFMPGNAVWFKYVDRNVCFFSAGGICSNPVYAEKYKYDRQEISAKYFAEAKYKLFTKKILRSLGLHI
jgi:glycosyltransferase involved in cell wall biosynthesis